MRVLLVEDDERVASALETALRRRGFETLRAMSAAEALAAPAVDLVLLDLGLPDRDGTEVCRELRRRGNVAIIMVTARSDERDLVGGLQLGADDYVVKPFTVAELIARMEAVMRRTARASQTRGSLTVGPLMIDMGARQVTVNGSLITLTRKEYDLLVAMAHRPGAVVSKELLFTEVWQATWAGNLHTVEVHVASLRSKLGEPTLIQTVRGIGYRLQVDDAPDAGRST